MWCSLPTNESIFSLLIKLIIKLETAKRRNCGWGSLRCLTSAPTIAPASPSLPGRPEQRRELLPAPIVLVVTACYCCHPGKSGSPSGPASQCPTGWPLLHLPLAGVYTSTGRSSPHASSTNSPASPKVAPTQQAESPPKGSWGRKHRYLYQHQ